MPEGEITQWMMEVAAKLASIDAKIENFCKEIDRVRGEHSALEGKVSEYDIKFAQYNGRVKAQNALLVGIALGAGAAGGGVVALVKAALGV